jgi:hypothetical protein
MTDPLIKAFDGMLMAKGEELADSMPKADRRAACTVSFAMGVQTALELSMLDNEVAHALIVALHERQATDDPLQVREFNATAIDFLTIVHALTHRHRGPR